MRAGAVIASFVMAVGALTTSDLHAGVTSKIVSPLIGSWEETFTKAEYIAAGADLEEQAQPVNWGHLVLTFRGDGRFTLAKLDPPRDRTGGTFRLRGGRVTLTCRCDPYPNWPYRWSIFRGALSFKRARPNNSNGTVNEPTGFVVKPWHRVK
jgi:hypothetical protein